MPLPERRHRHQNNFMGKKRIIVEKTEKVLKESEKLESIFRKDLKLKPLKLERGRLYINSSYNNTLLTLTDEKGNVVFSSSAGKAGFSGTKKGTPFAASQAAKLMTRAIKYLEIKEIDVFVKGIGQGRSAALRILASEDINISSISDVTPIPHDGCRPPRSRRV